MHKPRSPSQRPLSPAGHPAARPWLPGASARPWPGASSSAAAPRARPPRRTSLEGLVRKFSQDWIELLKVLSIHSERKNIVTRFGIKIFTEFSQLFAIFLQFKNEFAHICEIPRNVHQNLEVK